MSKSSFIAATAIGLTVFVTGCQTQPKTNGDARSLTTMISVEGSDTMMSLVKAWSDEFRKAHPATPVSMTSADSGGGIAALINSTTDIAVSSRDLSDAELALAKAKGVHLKKLTVARDAVAFIVNPTNSINALTLSQLKQIYTGKIKDWSELHGKSQPIQPYSREKNSGTYEYFHSHVMQDESDSKSVKLMPSIERLVESVGKEPGAIAYVGLGHALASAKKVKIEQIQLVDGGPSSVASNATTTDTYPLSRPLLIFSDEKAKPSVEEFLKFCSSDEGQKLVPATGYVPLR